MLDMHYWEKASAFHGHKCPGLAIGFKAVEGAIAELGLSDDDLPAVDEEIVCVTETTHAASMPCSTFWAARSANRT